MKDKKINIMNMTGHTIVVSGTKIEPSGNIRISFAFIEKEELINGLFKEYKAISGCNEELIPKIKNNIYIVSEMVCQSLPHRHDLYMCHNIIKDISQKIVGAKGIKVNPYYIKGLDLK